MLHKNSFLAIAEDLKVKGLTQSKSEEVRRQQHALTTPRPRDPPKDSHEPIPQPKRSRPVAFSEPAHIVDTIQNSYQAVDDDIHHMLIQEATHHNQVVDPNLVLSIFRNHNI